MKQQFRMGNGDTGIPAPKAMKVIKGEDNSARWQDSIEALMDYALVGKVYKEEPAIQMAKFRSIFGICVPDLPTSTTT